MFLPLTNNAEEIFNIVIFEKKYQIKQLWNTNGFWTLDITNSDGEILVCGVKIIAGELLLQQYNQIDFDLKNNGDVDPLRNNLSEFNLEIINKNV